MRSCSSESYRLGRCSNTQLGKTIYPGSLPHPSRSPTQQAIEHVALLQRCKCPASPAKTAASRRWRAVQCVQGAASCGARAPTRMVRSSLRKAPRQCAVGCETRIHSHKQHAAARGLGPWPCQHATAHGRTCQELPRPQTEHASPRVHAHTARRAHDVTHPARAAHDGGAARAAPRAR